MASFVEVLLPTGDDNGLWEEVDGFSLGGDSFSAGATGFSTGGVEFWAGGVTSGGGAVVPSIIKVVCIYLYTVLYKEIRSTQGS